MNSIFFLNNRSYHIRKKGRKCFSDKILSTITFQNRFCESLPLTKSIFILCSLIWSSFAYSQEIKIIQLNNASLEDIPQVGRPPKGWFNCGFPGESPSDIHPNNRFGVIKKAQDDETYVGMVTRDNHTWEGIGQHLDDLPLEIGKTYVIQLYLAQSVQYISLSRQNPDARNPINYNYPVLLRIWGGSGICERTELLAVSPPIKHSDWRMYQLSFTPQFEHSFIIFEAYYNATDEQVHNGNLLLDHISPLYPIELAPQLLPYYKVKMDNTYWQQYEHPLPFSTPALDNSSYVAPSVIYPTLKLPTINTVKELQQMIASDGPYVSFDKNKTKLSRENYFVLNRLYEQNFNLHRIVNAFQSIEGYKLVISVNGAKERIIDKRIFFLSQAFFDFGLDEEDFEFRPWPNPLREEDWLSIGLSNDVLLQVIPK